VLSPVAVLEVAVLLAIVLLLPLFTVAVVAEGDEEGRGGAGGVE
jgi:hypothetical protein